MSDEVTPSGLMWSPCPDCNGAEGGCEVCEGTGRVLVPADAPEEDVRTVEATPSSDSREDARALPEPTEEVAPEGAGDEREPKRLFGGLTASEAARLRHEKERARNAELESTQDIGHDVIVRTTVAVSSIIKRLQADAQKGNVQAARELRSWLSEVAVESRTSLEDLDERTRQDVLARVLAEIEQDRADGPAAEEGATPPNAGVPGVNAQEAPFALDGAETPAASETYEGGQESHPE